MKRFTTHITEARLNEENCSCCDNKIDADGKCGCGPDCEHCGGQHDVDEGSCGTVNASKKTVKEDYTASSEKSQFGGHRAHLKNKEGKTSYLGGKSYKKPEHAAGEAQVYQDNYSKGRGGNERAADKAVSDYRNKNKKHMHESQDLTEGKMKDFHDMVNKGMSAAEIAKKIKMPVKDVADFMKGMKEDLDEGGLWANIHAKRKRIKNGSKEKMKKPGSEGAPTDQDFKDASESVDLEEISKKTLTSYISKADKKAAKAGNSYSNAANRRHDFADDTPAMAKNAKIAQKRTDGADLARKKLNATYESVEEGLEQDGPKTKLGKSFGFGRGKKVSDYRAKKAQQRNDMNKKNDPGAAKKHLALSVIDKEKADKKAKPKGTSINKQWRKKMGYESVDLEEDATHSDKHINMAIGIASDKRYKGGNMTGAVKAMNKMKPGISDHPKVAAVLKRQNEDTKAGMDEAKKVSDMTPEEKAANDKKRKEYNEYQKSKRNESLDEARSSASDQAAKAGAYNGGKSGNNSGGKAHLSNKLSGDALAKHREKRSAEYEADLVKKRAENAARLKSYGESETNDLTAQYINENNISLDQLENMTEEEINELIGKAIGGAFKLGAKAVVGSARLAKKAANRVSVSGRADAADAKADKFDNKIKAKKAAVAKKAADRTRITAAAARLKAAKEAARSKPEKTNK